MHKIVTHHNLSAQNLLIGNFKFFLSIGGLIIFSLSSSIALFLYNEKVVTDQMAIKGALARYTSNSLYGLIQELSSLEEIGLIKCISVHSESKLTTLYSTRYKPSCNYFGLNHELKLASLNGNVWNIQFRNANAFKILIDLVAIVILLVIIFVLISYFIRQNYINHLKFEKLVEQNSKNLFELASQVSHDIRSPLAALNVVLNQIAQIPEEHRIIVRNAVGRINDISNQLLSKGKEVSQTSKHSFDSGSNSSSSAECRETRSLGPMLDSIVSEKRTQFRHLNKVEINLDLSKSYGRFVNIDAVEFMRVISNLLNNSIEAFEANSGAISISIEDSLDDKLSIRIKDNGKGIPPDILEKLGNLGVSHGKSGTTSGSGLGIYHAKRTIESFGGKFAIDSTVGSGTTIKIELPRGLPPFWHLEKIELAENCIVVICDDDSTIHALWSERLKSFIENHKVSIVNFSSGPELSTWVQTHRPSLESTLFLVDYELINQLQNGLDLIEQNNIASRSILVTSRNDEPAIVERCQRLKVQQVPKGVTSLVPIVIESRASTVDAVVLDDEPLQEAIWNFSAKQKKKHILFFKNPESMMARIKSIAKHTPFYIDSNLSDGIQGEDIAKQVFDLGYENVYIASGYRREKFAHLSFLKGVVGKEPHF